MDYSKMYAYLLCEIDKALTMMEEKEVFRAYQILLNACETCEEKYIESSISSPVTSEILSRVLGYCIANHDSAAYKAIRNEYGFILDTFPS